MDKPFTCNLAEAKELATLAQSKDVPIFSSSSLRYGVEVIEIQQKADETGAILGVEVCSPAPTNPHNPGLFHYGIPRRGDVVHTDGRWL